jgi:hypothetical protein
MIGPIPIEHPELLLAIADLRCQLCRATVCLASNRGRISGRDDAGFRPDELERELLLRPFPRLGQSPEQLDALAGMRRGLAMPSRVSVASLSSARWRDTSAVITLVPIPAAS